MENFRSIYSKELKNLEIENTDSLTESYISRKFKRKALKVHSDKTRSNDDEEFKELLNDYHRVLEAFSKLDLEAEKGVKKDDIQCFFENNNFAQEFTQSWTVFIEKEKVAAWKQEMNRMFPDPKLLQGNGVQYKSLVAGIYVYITLYDVTIPKMNIQGNHACIRDFVLNNLPEIYKNVTKLYDDIQIMPKLPINARIKLSTETVYTCDVCGKTYVRKALFRKHILTKHTSTIQQNVNVAIPLLNDTSQKEDDSTEALLEEHEEEESAEEQAKVIEEIGPQMMETNWQCGECEEIFYDEGSLNNHIQSRHIESEKQQQILESRLLKREEEYKSLQKKFELLERRHEQIKLKIENITNDNKKYAKNLIEVIKENTLLKETAKKDAETLEDTLSMNQVLIEEIKIKDATIEAEVFLSNLRKEKDVEITAGGKETKRTFSMQKM